MHFFHQPKKNSMFPCLQNIFRESKQIEYQNDDYDDKVNDSDDNNHDDKKDRPTKQHDVYKRTRESLLYFMYSYILMYIDGDSDSNILPYILLVENTLPE